ncbi:hypothetical protein NDU88_002138 [Pleurodeles waltl]|uniref:Uncharacterized protein n=1 Tax=Pleurodeles waltl TaxID=8319 RepID=A0AAV7P932_PLEWA|nr:hypothetical protein NDU88_002138 [Pleurodeles waltl]
MSTEGASMQELDKSDKLESAASSEGICPDLRVDGRGVMLKALSVELKGGFETSIASQVEIRGLCEDLGKKIDDLAGRTDTLEVGKLRMVAEENNEQIRYLKEEGAGVMAKMESLVSQGPRRVGRR